MKRNKEAKRGGYPPIQVRILQEDAEPVERVFVHPFRLGRDRECDIHLPLKHVSRTHAEINYTNQCWWVHDLDSTNGLTLNGRKVQHAPINDRDTVMLGKEGPTLEFRYVQNDASNGMGPAEAYDAETPERSLRTKTIWIVSSVLVLALVGIFFGGRQAEEKMQRRDEAESLFYRIKEHDASIARIRFDDQAGDDGRLLQLMEMEEERQRMTDRYKGYIIEVGLYKDLTPVERLIYNVTRFYNESEFGMPPAFLDRVQRAIDQYWLEENRLQFERALRKAASLGYTSHIVDTLIRNGLPVEFFYIPLVLTEFDIDAVAIEPDGSSRRGMWMLSRQAAQEQGMSLGVFEDVEQLDPSDDRHNFYASTDAAVRILRELYYGGGEVSGLLTMVGFLVEPAPTINLPDSLASTQPVTFFQGVPDGPRNRNYWTLLGSRDPVLTERVQELVARVFAASVIGQDPELFGYDFPNPLASYQNRQAR